MEQVKVQSEQCNFNAPSKEEFAIVVYEAMEQSRAADGFKVEREKIKEFADKIADIFEKYKDKAVEFIKDEERLEALLLRVEQKFQTIPNVGEKLAYIPQLALMIRSYMVKDYTEIDAIEIVCIIAALIYFVSPIDVIPDGIPGLGFLDDAIVAGIIVKWCQEDIDKYMAWLREKKQQN